VGSDREGMNYFMALSSDQSDGEGGREGDGSTDDTIAVRPCCPLLLSLSRALASDLTLA
jgi:hypothetical protein